MSFSLPPPYTKPPAHDTTLLKPSSKMHHHHHHHHHHNHRRKKRTCCICHSRYLPSHTRELGPYLIHRTRPDLVVTCPCSPSQQWAHPNCLQQFGVNYVCSQCNYIFPSRRYIRIRHMLTLLCHALSLASVIGLIFGLSYLGRALDELGLGKEMGPKLDGDETWQDHEMLEIVEWLDIVHYATGVAGEALLGLVYIVGVWLVIGLDRTLAMIWHILWIKMDASKKENRVYTICIGFSLGLLGLILGTYLLFFSWIWASVLNHLRRRFLDMKSVSSTHHELIA
jgi:hypothetical protein